MNIKRDLNRNASHLFSSVLWSISIPHHVHATIYEWAIRTHPKTIRAVELAINDSPRIASKYNVSYI